jgi:reactive intermediate/imine deaminase
MPKRIISIKKAPRPLGNYSQAWEVEHARLIFISGQVPVDKDGKPVGIGDMALQTRTALENLKGVLEDAGATLKDVFKLNIYVRDMGRFRSETPAIRKEYFPEGFPGSTLVEVTALALPEFLVEIEAVAAVG